MKKSIKTELQFSDQRIKDLLCSAFEGGSNYWIDSVDYDRKKRPKGCEYFHELPVLGGELIIHVFDHKPSPVILNKEALAKGIKIMAEKYPHHFGDFIKENDDAITADVFVQCCVFGEAIFG